ncbi:MAG TPA: hypothetical protein VMQ17_08120 [Candidatus Sulfotelmatobacter sp.]|nr:hypothetical protein [Candidatus Sulfotelmatobacter sp.]
MKFLFPLLLAFTLSAASASTGDSKTVSYKSGDETVQGILYHPRAKQARALPCI